LRHKAYPAIAERLGHEGAVKVGFAVDASGSLLSASVRSSSGFNELDQAALDAVQQAAPFDAIPAAAGKDLLSLSITLKFSLGG
jgi:protein TonB